MNTFGDIVPYQGQLGVNIQDSTIRKPLVFFWAMNTITMNDVDDPFEAKIDAMGENIHVKNVEIESNGRRN